MPRKKAEGKETAKPEKRGRGRPRSYTAEEFREAVEKYYESVTYEEPVYRIEETGEFSQRGKPILTRVPVMVQKDGELVQAVKTGFIEPPTVQGMCLAIGIHKTTFDHYEEWEGYRDTCLWWRLICESYAASLLMTKEGNVQGVMFNLKNNYGWTDKQEVQVSGGIEKYLEKIAEDNDGKSGQVL